MTPRLSSACSNQLSYRPGFGSLSRNWWRHGDSNPGHPACKAGALPTELYPQLRFSVKKGRHARRAGLRSRRPAVYTSLVRCGPSRVPLALPSGRNPTCALPCTCSMKKGGDPAAGSPTATLLRLHPSYQSHLRTLPPCGWLQILRVRPASMM